MSNYFSEDTVQLWDTVINQLKDAFSMNSEHITYLPQKLGATWAMFGISSWSDAAGFFAFLVSFATFCEYAWKKWVRPLMVKRGVLQPIVQAPDDVIQK